MGKTELNQYKGKLTSAEIAAGINAAELNARRLYEDAKLLFENGRLPSALSLAILSIEESGKPSILRTISLETEDKEIKSKWREYRTHTEKNQLWLLFDLFLTGKAKRLEDFRPLTQKGAEHTIIIECLKQVGFYTDCIDERIWVIPGKSIKDKLLVEHIIKIAEGLLGKGETTEKEIDLWIKHMKPVWKSSLINQEEALINWSKEMHKEGLMSGDPDGMRKFIHEGLDLPVMGKNV